MLSTRFSLLLNLRDLANRKSGGEFVETYTPVISNTIRRYRVSSSDADDILQEVLLQMSKTIQRYDQDPNKGKFRSYLRQVTANKVKDYSRKRSNNVAFLENPALIAENEIHQEIWNDELNRSLFRIALSRVKQQSKELTWNCFEQHVLRERNAETVAEECETSLNAVYINSSRTLTRVREMSLKLKREHDCESN